MPYGDFKDLTRRVASDCVIKHLILLKFRNMIDMKGIFFQWFISSLIKKLLLRVHRQRP